MVNIFLAGSVDYVSVVRAFYPILLRKCRKAEQGNLPLRLAAALDDTAETILVEIIQRIPDGARNELVCQSLKSFQPLVLKILNSIAEEICGRDNFAAGGINADATAEGCALTLEDVQINYQGLLESDSIKDIIDRFAGKKHLGLLADMVTGVVQKAAASKDSDEIDQMIAGFLSNAFVQKQLRHTVRDILAGKGVVMELKKIAFTPCRETSGPSITRRCGMPDLSPEAEDALIDAISTYFREIVPQ